MSQEITVTIDIGDGIKADVDVYYTKGARATQEEPADPDEFDITKVYMFHEDSPTHGIDLTEYLLQTSDFEDRYTEMIQEAVLKELQDNTPDCDDDGDDNGDDSREGW